MINSGQFSIANANKIAEAFRKYRPRFLKGTASAIYFLALCLKEAGITDISFKAIFSNAEVLIPQYRALAQSVLDCPVLDSYGHMEGTVAISQCLHGGYHVNSDYGYLEFENLRQTKSGDTILGEAVGTSLYNLAMPLIRYEVGDDIEFFATEKRCPCGRGLPIIKEIHGRREDTVVTPDGRFITSLIIIPEFLEGARFIQFIQENATKLSVHVVPEESWNPSQKDKLAYYVKKLVGKEMAVHIHQITQDDIITDASGKIRTVISQATIRDS